jgi:choline dehydrogenase
MVQDNFDYIIVGAGSAGCVLANRLSTDKNCSVLLIEAGGPDSHPLVKLPIGWTQISYHDNYNWGYRIAPSEMTAQRAMAWPRAKMMGGCSSTNGMIYIRGQSLDYDHWAQLGNNGWGWDQVLPYFKRSEDYSGTAAQADVYHGVGGALHVCTVKPTAICDMYLKACADQGIATVDDLNRGNQKGAAYFDITVKKGRRHNTVSAFLKPVRSRKNLTIMKHSLVKRVLFKGKAAVGVEVVCKGKVSNILVRREVIISAGTINSPQLLQLSGIGNKNLLDLHGINTVVDLPGVGENLQDHLGAVVANHIRAPLGLNAELTPHRLAYNLYLYLTKGEGILNFPGAEVGGFFCSDPSLDRPDLQMHFTRVSGDRDIDNNSTLDDLPGVTSIAYLTRPESRGSVKITSNDSAEPPLIDANYLATENDRIALIAGVKRLRDIFASASLATVIGQELRPGVAVESDEDILAYIQQHGTTAFHPVGTCKMGNDDLAVVDDRLRVYGVSNLRVVDASIMPTLISGNTNAATIMIAEKGADLILGVK